MAAGAQLKTKRERKYFLWKRP